MIEKWAPFANPCCTVKVLKKRIIVQWDDEGNFGFSFTLAFNENYTDIFCSVTLQENVRTVITKLFTI